MAKRARPGKHPYHAPALLSAGPLGHRAGRTARSAAGRDDARPGGGARRKVHPHRRPPQGRGCWSPTRWSTSGPGNWRATSSGGGPPTWPSRPRRPNGWRTGGRASSTRCWWMRRARAKGCSARPAARGGREWSPALVAGCAVRQDGILEQAAALVRPGGRLVYSTCTFAPEEDEGTVARFLARTPSSRWRSRPLDPGLSREGRNGASGILRAGTAARGTRSCVVGYGRIRDRARATSPRCCTRRMGSRSSPPTPGERRRRCTGACGRLTRHFSPRCSSLPQRKVRSA